LLKVGHATSGHFGLLDMRERAEKIAARFTLNSRPGHGTEILLLIADVTTNNRPDPNIDS
jgi:signal transduction histidine kinase